MSVSTSDSIFGGFALRKITIYEILFYALVLFWCYFAVVGSSNPDAVAQLETRGFSSIKIEGRSSRGCRVSQFYRTEFSATFEGVRVSGLLCQGFGEDAQVQLLGLIGVPK